MVAPVVTPANSNSSLALKSVWLPPGTWVDLNSNAMHPSDGTVTLQKAYDLREIPVFARAGAVLTFRPRNTSTSVNLCCCADEWFTRRCGCARVCVHVWVLVVCGQLARHRRTTVQRTPVHHCPGWIEWFHLRVRGRRGQHGLRHRRIRVDHVRVLRRSRHHVCDRVHGGQVSDWLSAHLVLVSVRVCLLVRPPCPGPGSVQLRRAALAAGCDCRACEFNAPH